MLRTSVIAAVTVALLGGTALAQPASAPPANLSQPGYDDDDRAGPPPQGAVAPNSQAQASADQQRDRDMFCRRDAAARTGYVTPGQAARNEQTRGTIGGTLGGAALGALIGAGAGNAGLGAAAGAGAGLLAGTAIGSNNADRAARDVQADYSAAYYDCMHEAGGPAPRTASSYYDRGYYDADYPPPPPPAYAYPAPAYYPAPYPYYYGPGYYGPAYYGPGYYGPSISLGFGFGGGWHGHRGWHH